MRTFNVKSYCFTPEIYHIIFLYTEIIHHDNGATNGSKQNGFEEDNSSDWDSTTSMEDIKSAAPRPLSSKENSKIEESAFAFSMKQHGLTSPNSKHPGEIFNNNHSDKKSIPPLGESKDTVLIDNGYQATDGNGNNAQFSSLPIDNHTNPYPNSFQNGYDSVTPQGYIFSIFCDLDTLSSI